MYVHDYDFFLITDQSITSTINITSTSYVLPTMSMGTSDVSVGRKVEISISVISSEVLITTLHEQLQTNSVQSTSPDIPIPDITRSLFTNSMEKILLTSSTMNITSFTHSTANTAMTASPRLPYNNDNGHKGSLCT